MNRRGEVKCRSTDHAHYQWVVEENHPPINAGCPRRRNSGKDPQKSSTQGKAYLIVTPEVDYINKEKLYNKSLLIIFKPSIYSNWQESTKSGER